MSSRHHFCVAVLLAGALGACASVAPERAQAHLQAWRGHPLADLELAFGPAQNPSTGADARYALWTRQKTSNSPTISLGLGGSSGHIGAGISTTLFGGQQYDYCTVQAFYDEQNIVRDLHWNGEPALCVKYFPAPATGPAQR